MDRPSRSVGAPAPRPFRCALACVILVYLVTVTIVLIQTRGLPYGLDNNESFSSAIHARNLATYGVGRSFGLTDESYGTSPAAHPFIHSHQGNFPRIFTFGLYELGAHRIEAQIVATTYTIGLLGIIVAFLFFAESINPLFATLACLVFISDYFLFGQWQLNTYRVWHCFFFFSSLLCVRRCLGQPTKGTLALAVCNFAGLCYWEYVFAFYVLLVACGYAGLMGWRTPRRVLTFFGSALAGGAVAAPVLGLQLAAYMGWSNVMMDVSYTLHARNSSVDSEFSAKVTAFYAQHKVLFWPNYMDASKLRNAATFWDSLIGHQLQYYSPWLASTMLIVAMGWFLMWAVRAGFGHPSGAPLPTAVRRGVAIGAVAALLAAAGWLIARQPVWYDGLQAPVWREAGWAGWAAPGVFLTALVVVLGMMPVLGPHCAAVLTELPRIRCLFAFLLAGLLGYLATYRVFTGYVFSGYLNRQAPLLVFLSDPLLALVPYTLVLPLRHIPWARWREAWANSRNGSGIFRLLAAALLLVLGVNWLRLQREYLKIIPLDHFRFIKRLAEAPYRHASFVVNTYAAPVAYQTQSWAYFEPAFFLGGIRLTAHGFEKARDPSYQWLADLETNPAYAKPDYALIIRPTTWSDGLADRLAFLAGKAVATDNEQRDGLLSRAARPFSAYLHNRLVETDAGPGPGTFTIIKLDWDYPAYLLPLPSKDSELAAETDQARPKLTLIDLVSVPPMREPRRSGLAAIVGDGREKPDWATLAQSDPGWRPAGSSAPLPEASTNSDGPEEIWMTTVATGKDIRLDFQTDPQPEKVELRANDYSGSVDLRGAKGGLHSVHFDSATTGLPIVPGQYVALHRTDRGLELSYRFAQQEGAPEENTTITLLERKQGGNWRSARTIVLLGRDRLPVDLFAFRSQNQDSVREFSRRQKQGDTRSYLQWLEDQFAANPLERTRPGTLGSLDAWVTPAASGDTPIRHILIRVMTDPNDSLVAVVRPGTRTKQGPGYFSNYLDPAISSPADGHRPAPALTYGSVELELQLPARPAGHSEPLVTTGIAMAGDFVYLIYADSDHIQIGFDHWGVGGALSPPLRVDYRRPHRFRISMGSLYPQDGNVRYQDLPAAVVDRIKRRVTVTLDGQTALAFASECYESPPAFVSIGKNPIGGSTTGPVFSGEVLKASRVFEISDH